ncbi:MAG: L-glutamate gamma-semialdehyde dehydrogenase [Actinomycetes bacterium]
MSTTARAVPPTPTNEPVRTYAPGTAERAGLVEALRRRGSEVLEAPCVIGGREVRTGNTFEWHAPHDRGLHLVTAHAAGVDEVHAAIEAAAYAKPDWAALPWEARAAVFLRAADLIAGEHRDELNAATMLGQSKSVVQAEIDAACELIDFLRFNVHFYAEILADQPASSPGVWNRTDHRPLEGFVLAMTPFNFTAIAGNLPTAPALAGNTVVWKPSEKQVLAAQLTLQVLERAGLPPGVINLVHGDGARVAEVCLEHPDLAGLHFTGSADVFRSLWGRIGQNMRHYRTFPRVVGETGGKDFVLAHPSAEVDPLVTALVRGAFEYQGQKCSAASRAYVPDALWPAVREGLADTVATLTYGDVADLRVFGGAVIDEVAFRRHADVLAQVASDDRIDVLVGGTADDSEGWFVQPTVLVTSDPQHELLSRELFGPILTVLVTPTDAWEHTLDLVDATSPYGLTGAVFARDRVAIEQAAHRLRQAAGNFYVNDKPTGAVVGQQPFGGSRGSGTNDKAGGKLNLLRWISQRSIKETFVPPTDHTYPSMLPE